MDTKIAKAWPPWAPSYNANMLFLIGVSPLVIETRSPVQQWGLAEVWMSPWYGTFQYETWWKISWLEYFVWSKLSDDELRIAVKKVDSDFPIKIHNKAKKLIKKYLSNTSISDKILSTLGVTLFSLSKNLFFCQRVQTELRIETIWLSIQAKEPW